MGDRWRLGLVERSVLEAMEEFGARGPDRPHLKCSRFAQFLPDERGITRRYSDDALCTPRSRGCCTSRSSTSTVTTEAPMIRPHLRK